MQSPELVLGVICIVVLILLVLVAIRDFKEMSGLKPQSGAEAPSADAENSTVAPPESTPIITSGMRKAMRVLCSMSFEMPLVDGLPAAIYAFLRTSERGTWAVDSSRSNDDFVQEYIRGTITSSAPPGELRHTWTLTDDSYLDFVRRKWDGWQSPATGLSVKLRPEAGAIKVWLECRFLSPHSDLLHRLRPELGTELEFEMEALVAYLMDCYQLAELPALARR